MPLVNALASIYNWGGENIGDEARLTPCADSF